MEYYIEDPYLEEELDQFNEWYKIECINKIKELSRQLRTFFNYNSEVIKYRYRSNLSPTANNLSSTFSVWKQKIEIASQEFINQLKKIKKNAPTLEKGIINLFLLENKTQLKNLSKSCDLLFIMIHYFSEETLHRQPIFLKYILKLAIYTCLVKKCLQTQFCDFFEELGKNYKNLETELTHLIPNQLSSQEGKKEKSLEECLIS